MKEVIMANKKKKPRCGTEPAWELFHSDIIILLKEYNLVNSNI